MSLLYWTLDWDVEMWWWEYAAYTLWELLHHMPEWVVIEKHSITYKDYHRTIPIWWKVVDYMADLCIYMIHHNILWTQKN